MRILIASNAPWVPSGYGVQTGMFAPRFVELGHDVAISAFHGLQGAPTTWKGIQVLPRHSDPWGSDSVMMHARHLKADLVLTICDVWVLYDKVFEKLNTASWVPIDAEPLGAKDKLWLEAVKPHPIAMARHGERMMAAAGITSTYIPHGIDTSVTKPMDQAEVRKSLGLPESAFIVGLNAANKGSTPSRKAFPEQFQAFARLRKRHNDAILLLHTDMVTDQGLDLLTLADACGIDDAGLLWSDQYTYRTGMFTEVDMAAWYSACDIVTQATYGEGFGLPTLEAQACGVPVVVTNNSASAEMVSSGWKVSGHRYWNPHHLAWWSSPDVDQLARVYEKAYAGEAAKRRGAKAVEFAADYDADHIARTFWKPFLDGLA